MRLGAAGSRPLGRDRRRGALLRSGYCSWQTPKRGSPEGNPARFRWKMPCFFLIRDARNRVRRRFFANRQYSDSSRRRNFLIRRLFFRRRGRSGTQHSVCEASRRRFIASRRRLNSKNHLSLASRQRFPWKNSGPPSKRGAFISPSDAACSIREPFASTRQRFT